MEAAWGWNSDHLSSLPSPAPGLTRAQGRDRLRRRGPPGSPAERRAPRPSVGQRCTPGQPGLAATLGGGGVVVHRLRSWRLSAQRRLRVPLGDLRRATSEGCPVGGRRVPGLAPHTSTPRKAPLASRRERASPTGWTGVSRPPGHGRRITRSPEGVIGWDLQPGLGSGGDFLTVRGGGFPFRWPLSS